MLATLGGSLALLMGLAILVLPLLAPELSRPRDAAWGALVLLLGLDLVTTAERLSGAPMLGVLCGGLLIGRLGSEVAQARWRQLSDEERQQLGSAGRWRRSLDQLLASLAGLLTMATDLLGSLRGGLAGNRRARAGGKRWVRPETSPAPGAEAPGQTSPGEESPAEPAAPAPAQPAVQEVAGFGEIETLLVEAGALTQATADNESAEPDGGAG